jgi:hypothetical protein
MNQWAAEERDERQRIVEQLTVVTREIGRIETALDVSHVRQSIERLPNELQHGANLSLARRILVLTRDRAKMPYELAGLAREALL